MKLKYCSRLNDRARRRRYEERSKYKKMEKEIEEKLRREIKEKHGVELGYYPI